MSISSRLIPLTSLALCISMAASPAQAGDYRPGPRKLPEPVSKHISDRIAE